MFSEFSPLPAESAGVSVPALVGGGRLLTPIKFPRDVDPRGRQFEKKCKAKEAVTNNTSTIQHFA